ncbi:MAG: DUF2934 domain-containing protein [Planctomycetes bacterium]|nr:DUF2934 domain-containing protein [Planctomycetota bacterium]
MATNIVQNSEFATRHTHASPHDHSARPIQVQPVITTQQISERAYFIFLARGGEPGTPEADWARAERELRAEALRKSPITLDSPARTPVSTSDPEVRPSAGIPSGIASRRSPVLFSGG